MSKVCKCDCHVIVCAFNVSLISLSQISRFFQELDVKRVCSFEFLSETRIKSKKIFSRKKFDLPKKRMSDDKKTGCIVSYNQLLPDFFTDLTDGTESRAHRMSCRIRMFLRSLSFSFKEF